MAVDCRVRLDLTLDTTKGLAPIFQAHREFR